MSSTNQDSSSSVMPGEETANVWIAWPSTSTLETIGSSIEVGRSPRMRSIASLTSCTAWVVGTSMRKITAVVEVPSLIVDWMWSTPVMLATASSISLVTCVSSSAGEAPLCETLIETIGTSILGKRVIGRPTND
ncbi:hypothetical protein D3C87_1626660 [compost metagenome]